MKKFIVALMFIFNIWCSFCFAAGEEIGVYKIDFDIKANSDGTLNITENWELNRTNSSYIYINLQTNTNEVSDIEVFRKSDDIITTFVSGDYTKENIKTGNYSILESGESLMLLCGIGRFKNISVSYTIDSKVTLYSDCADFNIDLLNRDLGIQVNSITGQITLPSKSGNVHAWQFVSGVNSEVKNIKEGTIRFEATDIDEDGVRLRVITPVSLFNGDIINQVMQENIIREEKNLVLSTNAKRTAIRFVINLVESIILAVIIINIFKYIKELGKAFVQKPTKKIKYSKELPFDGITPGQAAFIKDINLFKTGNIFAATLLNLKIRGIIDIVYVGEKKNLENAFIKILDINPILYVEEKPIFEFLVDYIEKFQKSDLMISVNVLKKYVASSPDRISKLKKEIKESIKSSISSYDVKADKRINKRLIGIIYYLITIVVMILAHGVKFNIFSLYTWIILLSMINIVFCINIAIKTNVFNQEGTDQREMLRAFERYMLEFSSSKSKGLPEIALWEYYIIFAMAFGISKKVLGQIKACYPNIEDSTFMNTYIACENLEKCKFNRSFVFATSTE